jgi:hypothetical protein
MSNSSVDKNYGTIRLILFAIGFFTIIFLANGGATLIPYSKDNYRLISLLFLIGVLFLMAPLTIKVSKIYKSSKQRSLLITLGFILFMIVYSLLLITPAMVGSLKTISGDCKIYRDSHVNTKAFRVDYFYFVMVDDKKIQVNDGTVNDISSTYSLIPKGEEYGECDNNEIEVTYLPGLNSLIDWEWI